jgi:hypothetical protein
MVQNVWGIVYVMHECMVHNVWCIVYDTLPLLVSDLFSVVESKLQVFVLCAATILNGLYFPVVRPAIAQVFEWIYCIGIGLACTL